MRARQVSWAGLVLGFVLAGCVARPEADVRGQDVAAMTSLPEALPAQPGAEQQVSQAEPPAPPPQPVPPQPPSAAAFAPPAGAEALMVRAPLNLAGFWRLYSPHRINIKFGVPMAVTYDDVGPDICRILQHGADLQGVCVSNRVMQLTGKAGTDEVALTLTGDGPEIGVTARLAGLSRLQGKLRVHVAGFIPLPSLPVSGVKLAYRKYPEQRAANLRKAVLEWAAKAPEAASLGQLGKLTQIETIPIFGKDPKAHESADIFTAEFDSGTRLCAVSGARPLVCG